MVAVGSCHCQNIKEDSGGTDHLGLFVRKDGMKLFVFLIDMKVD